MPTVTRISISPVKGLALLHPEEVRLERTGVPENRRFHIVDADGRRYNQLRNGGLVQITQEYDDADGRLVLHFPDGEIAVGRIALGAAITTQNPETGVPDFDTLRMLAAYRPVTANEAGKKHLAFGVYGEVVEPGRVALGDSVDVVQQSLFEQTA